MAEQKIQFCLGKYHKVQSYIYMYFPPHPIHSPNTETPTAQPQLVFIGIKVFDNSRDTIENIPVDDQEVPDPRDSSISKTKDSFGPF